MPKIYIAKSLQENFILEFSRIGNQSENSSIKLKKKSWQKTQYKAES